MEAIRSRRGSLCIRSGGTGRLWTEEEVDIFLGRRVEECIGLMMRG